MAAFSQKGVGTFTFLSPVSPNVRMSKVPKPNLNKHIQDHTNTFDLQNFVHDVKNILQVTISERFTKGKCFLEKDKLLATNSRQIWFIPLCANL